MIDAMIDAAELARKASRIDGSRTVEIVVTEEGLVVRGVAWTGDRKDAHSIEVHWRELDLNPGLAANAVRLVDERLP